MDLHLKLFGSYTGNEQLVWASRS